MANSLLTAAKVRLAGAVSTLLLLASMATAHEVMPAIADMQRDGDRLVFRVEANVESFLADIDLQGIEDTNASENSDAYDRFRAMPPEELSDRFEAFFPEFAEGITVRAGSTDLPLSLQGIEVPEVGNEELARTSLFTFSAELPPGAQAAEVGWDAAYGDLVLRQNGVEEPYDGLLRNGAISPPIDLAGGNQMGGWETFFSYIPVGVDHIVPLGLDHILFVLGLFFLAPRIGALLWQVSAFTLAHTITLALAALGYVSVPASIVEPLIAASIVYVAVENVWRSGALSPWRPAVIFGFGLLHGLGFASVLAEFGLPEETFIPALVGFNIGVEIGQLMVIAVAYLIVVSALRSSSRGTADRGMGALYLALAVVAVPALAVPVSQMTPEMIEGLTPLLAAAAILLGFSAAAVTAGGEGTYTRIVAMPASILIALVGAWWVVERVFL